MNDTGSDRIVAAFAHRGAETGVLGHKTSYAAASKFAHRVFPMQHPGSRWWSNLRIGACLRSIVTRWQPDLVIPLDDLAARTLRDPRILRQSDEATAALIERSFGRSAFREAACSRKLVSEAAEQLGIHVPPHAGATRFAALESQAAAFGYPVVLKRDHTCGGFGVTIVGGHADLRPAFRRANRKAILKRLMAWIPGFGLPRDDAITIQKHIDGPMAFRIVACRDGRVLDGINFLAEQTHPGRTGASTVVRPLDSDAMDKATGKLVGALGCSGFVSVDFILGHDGNAYLIELNARPPASGHLGALYGHDIYQALLSSLDPVRVAQTAPAVPAPASIALFPRELDRDPRGQFADRSSLHHDIPWDDPGVLELYKQWLQRRHPAHRGHLHALLAPDHDPTAVRRDGGVPHEGNETSYHLSWQAKT